MFLNSLFNASSTPSDHSHECIGYSEVGSNQGSTLKSVLFHGIFFLRLIIMFTSATLNNAVYVISVSQALITTARRGRFFSKPPHHSVKLNFDWSTIKRSTEKTPLESRHYPSNLNFARAVNRAPSWKPSKVVIILLPQFPISFKSYLLRTCGIYMNNTVYTVISMTFLHPNLGCRYSKLYSNHACMVHSK